MPAFTSLNRSCPLPSRVFLCVLLAAAGFLAPAHGADAAADAIAALSQLTNPARLALLPDDAFAEQLGPALGWLHVGRRRDVSPEAIIARALLANGLAGTERGREVREALLRNLARADGWELFNHTPSAQAMALGQPAPILAGLHRGHFARAVLLPRPTPGSLRGREFADLALRADDEPLPRPAPIPKTRRPRADERLVKSRAPRPRALRPALRVPPPPIEYDDALPAADPEPPAAPSGTGRREKSSVVQ